MNPVTAIALVATLAIGALVAAQPAVNAELAGRTSDLAAAFISASVTLLVLGIVFLAFGDHGSLGKLREVPIGYLAGGIMGAAIIGVSLVTVRQLGAGGVAAAAIAGQIIVAAVLDQLGVLGLTKVPLTPLRLVGVVSLIFGTLVITLK